MLTGWRFKTCLALVAVLSLYALDAVAVSAYPGLHTVVQPDTGEKFLARAVGDEHVHWVETSEGYSIVQDNGTWYYAKLDDSGQLAPSTQRVTADQTRASQTFPKHLRPTVEVSTREEFVPRRLNLAGTKALSRTQKILTILVDFSNITCVYSDSSFQSLIFGATDSVKEFFLESSYNGFQIEPVNESYGTANDGVVHVTMATAHPDVSIALWKTYVGSYISAADAYVDFSAYDSDSNGSISAAELSIILILAGYDEAFGSTPPTPNAWPHKSNLSPSLVLDGKTLLPYALFSDKQGFTSGASYQSTIGVMCHELGHLMLSLPDLYDTDGSSEGVGEWCLMGSGSWNSVGTHGGETPAHLSAWPKMITGITIPTEISSATSGVSLAEAATNSDAKRIWIDAYQSPRGESFLIENRQLTGYDAGLPGNGMLIWHIDSSRTGNTLDTQRLVDLEEADGLGHLDSKTNRGDTGDSFPGSTSNTSFTDSSNPNAHDNDGASTGIVVNSISASAATMTADVTPLASLGDYITYDDNGYSTAWGYSSTTVWTAIRLTNSTAANVFDGFEVYVADTTAQIDFYLYQSLTGTTPTTLLHTETGFSGVSGWNRFLLGTPQSFPVGADRVMVLKIVNASSNWPAAADATGADSGRAYLDSNGVGAYFALSDDFCQVALLSSAGYVSGLAVVDGLNVDITFSDAMGSGVTTAANYALSGTGKGTLSTNPASVANAGGNTYRLTWTSGEMLDGGNITVTVSGVQDGAGNAIGSPNSGTHAGGGIGVAPTVQSVAVASGSAVDVTFSEAMGAGVTTAANYALSGDGQGSLAATPNSVVNTGGSTYRLTWSGGEMVDGGDITITVSGAQDSAGNAIGTPDNGTDTGGGIGVAPSVQSVAVASGTEIDVTFSEAMGSGVLTAANYALSDAGQGSLSAAPDIVANTSGNTYRLTWNSGEMMQGGDITITVTGVQDSAGNAIGAPDSGTDTGGGMGVAPTVQSVAVASGSAVDVTFSEAMGNGVLTAANYALSGSGQGSLPATADSVVNVIGDTYRLTWSSGEMAQGGDVTITVTGVQDSVGNAIGTPNSGTDTGGGSGVAPTVQSVAVVNGTEVDVTFSEAMGSGVTTAANYALSDSGQGSLAATPDSVANTLGDTYRLTWNSGEMVDGGDITITVANAQDLAGNAVGAPDSGTDVGGGVGTAPTVTLNTTLSSPTSTSPIPVTVEFSETVTGFTLEDVQTVNGSAGNFQGSLDSYSFDLTPTAQGTIEASLLSGAGNDTAGNPSEPTSFSHVFLVASTLELDQSSYGCGESVSIALYDFDLQGGGTQSVTLSSDSGDSESVFLSEMASPGHFDGSVALEFAPAILGDAVLQISSGGILTATYHDVDNGAGGTDDLTDTATATCLDFGDAPDTYATTLSSNGARHGLGSGLYLGAAVDGETDGAPSAGATGDDASATDDEDGVSFTSALAPGIAAGLSVTASAGGKLDAWVDFNVDGDFADAGEQVFAGQTLTVGANALVVNVPSSAVVTAQTYARFRCSSAGGLAYSGSAADGEVEDYAVVIEPAPVLEVTYATQDFGTVELGSCATRTFTVRNAGGAILIGTATVAAPFEVTANAAYSLGESEEAIVSVDFCPGGLGNFSATLTFTGGGGGSVVLSGACVAVTPDTWVDFGNTGAEDGTQAHPYNTLAEGIAQAATGGELRIVAGQTAETPRITKRLKLNAEGGAVRLGDGTAKLLKGGDADASTTAAATAASSGLETGDDSASRGEYERAASSGGYRGDADAEDDSAALDTAEAGVTELGLNPALEPLAPREFGGCTCPGATGGMTLRELLEQLFVLGVALGAGWIWHKK